MRVMRPIMSAVTLPLALCRTSVISMSLKTGIVGLPNVGKVSPSKSQCRYFLDP